MPLHSVPSRPPSTQAITSTLHPKSLTVPGKGRHLQRSCWGRTHFPSWGVLGLTALCCPLQTVHTEGRCSGPWNSSHRSHRTAGCNLRDREASYISATVLRISEGREKVRDTGRKERKGGGTEWDNQPRDTQGNPGIQSMPCFISLTQVKSRGFCKHIIVITIPSIYCCLLCQKLF